VLSRHPAPTTVDLHRSAENAFRDRIVQHSGAESKKEESVSSFPPWWRVFASRRPSLDAASSPPANRMPPPYVQVLE